MPSESEQAVAAYFHASRQLAKAERRRGNVKECPIYKALWKRAEQQSEVRKLEWLAAIDEYERGLF